MELIENNEEGDVLDNLNSEEICNPKQARVSFKTAGTKLSETHKSTGKVLLGNPVNIICLNIPSYMGGASNPWGSSKNKSGLMDKSGKN